MFDFKASCQRTTRPTRRIVASDWHGQSWVAWFVSDVIQWILSYFCSSNKRPLTFYANKGL